MGVGGVWFSYGCKTIQYIPHCFGNPFYLTFNLNRKSRDLIQHDTGRKG